MLSQERVIDTGWLTHASFRPTAPHRVVQRRLAIGALVLSLIGAGYAMFGDLFMQARDVAALRAEREALTARIERLQTELAVETAKHSELERNAAALNGQVAELKAQVAFLKARKVPARNAE